MMDHMVVRLGKYLRVAGYDADWDLRLRTQDLIVKANGTGRVFVTRNSHVREQCPPANRLILLNETDPVRQFDTLARTLCLDPAARLFSRCIRCNVELQSIDDKREIEVSVHPNVYARHDAFFRCPRCETVFWHGSHVTNTCRKLGLAPPASPPGHMP